MTTEFDQLERCTICPRTCRTNRHEKAGALCKAGDHIKVARAALHFWEEPPISGEKGSGAIFFSHCALKCVYCQNKEISTGGFGLEISPERLYEIFFELKEQGAHNINLVSPSHYFALIAPVIKRAKADGLNLPVIYNGSGYERVETLKDLEGLIDIWLTDYKYSSNQLAQKLSRARDYPQVALEALKEMDRQNTLRGSDQYDGAGMMKQGIIVRHLILPEHVDQSKKVLQIIYDNFGTRLKLSLMSQYTPTEVNTRFAPELGRAITKDEYEEVLDFADDLELDYFWQEGEACKESFIPSFDTTGVLNC